MIKVDFFNFFIVGLFLLVWNAVFMFVNVESRRNKWHVPAAISGLHG